MRVSIFASALGSLVLLTNCIEPGLTARSSSRSSCGGGTSNSSGGIAQRTCASTGSSSDAEDGVELITDVGAMTGFRVTEPCASVNDRVGQGVCANRPEHDVKNPFHPSVTAAPRWTLQQWGSRSTIPLTGVPYGDGIAWANNDKRMAIFPSGIFEMGIDGNQEFGGTYRQFTSRTDWPSFNFGFNITNPSNYQTGGSGPVSTMRNLYFNLDARVANNTRNIKEGWDPSKNQVIFVAYITVQQLNPNAPGYGKYVWIGVPIFNDNEEFPSAYINNDAWEGGNGTGMLIYSIPYIGFSNASIHGRHWTHLQRDILPDIHAAMGLAKQHGLIDSADLNNYYVAGIIIGYEVTGLNQTWFQFKTPSLKARR